MYIPKINQLKDDDEIYRFMRENPFVIIVSQLDGELVATHAPAELEKNEAGRYLIRTHIAKANRQWEGFEGDKNVMVIFNGPHTYISSSWYDHVNVPTWNYVAIHVYGKPRMLNREETIGVLDRLTKRYEANSKQPFDMSKLTSSYLESHLRALVAFEIPIDRIDAKQKLSQNRNEKNFNLVLEQLAKRDDEQSKAVKEEMERIKTELFNKT